jgi:hypothetical protein
MALRFHDASAFGARSDIDALGCDSVSALGNGMHFVS